MGARVGTVGWKREGGSPGKQKQPLGLLHCIARVLTWMLKQPSIC